MLFWLQIISKRKRESSHGLFVDIMLRFAEGY